MTHLLFLQNLGIGELLVIALIIILLFGGRKIPELMKGIGKGVKSFKDGVKGVEDEVKKDDSVKETLDDINKEINSDGKKAK